jgi:hypothetical protein
VVYVLLALAVIVVVLAGAFVTFFVHRRGAPAGVATRRPQDQST